MNETPQRCPRCGSDDPVTRRILQHPTEDAWCYDKFHVCYFDTAPVPAETMKIPLPAGVEDTPEVRGRLAEWVKAEPASPEPPRCPSCNSNHPLANGSWAVPCNDPWHAPTGTPREPCSYCQDTRHWGKVKDIYGDGVLRHWSKSGDGFQVNRPCHAAAAPTWMGEGSELIKRATEYFRYLTYPLPEEIAEFTEKENAALRSQLEEALDRGNAYLAEMTQWRGKHGQAERDLATAQARIAHQAELLGKWRLWAEHADDCKCNSYGEGCTCGLNDIGNATALALAEPQYGEK